MPVTDVLVGSSPCIDFFFWTMLKYRLLDLITSIRVKVKFKRRRSFWAAPDHELCSVYTWSVWACLSKVTAS